MNDGPDAEQILDLATAIADGRCVDWSRAPTGVDSNLLANLRTLAQLATLPIGDGTPPLADPQPKRWGHLQLMQPLGQGGFGVVWRAFDTVLQRQVALKLRHPVALAGSERAAIDEARRLARVRHPRVLAVHGADIHDGRIGIWTDLVRGQTLEEYLQNGGTLAWRDLLPLAEDLAAAVAAVHEAGLVHGDIKPGNVMLDQDRKVVLMDFGAGGEHSSADLQGMGSPLSTAPERFTAGVLDASADVYSLGALYFRLLCGEHPIAATSLKQLCDRHVAGTPPSWSLLPRGVPRPLRALLAAMLAADPRQRPSADTVRLAIARLRAAPHRRRRRWSWAVVVAALAIGMLVASAGYWQARHAEGQARSAQTEAEAINAFLRDILASPRPTESGRNTLMTEVLEQAHLRLAARFAEQPRLGDEVRVVLAHSFDSLGNSDVAMQLRRSILDNRTDSTVWDDPAVLEVAYELALDHVEQREFEAAEALLVEIEHKAGNSVSQSPRLGIIRICVDTALAVWRGDPAQAQRLAEQNWRQAQTVLARYDHYYTLSRYQLSQSLYDLGRFAEAEPLLSAAVDESLALFGERHAITLRDRHLLAAVAARLGRLDRAEILAEANLEVAMAWLGENDRFTVNALSTLSNIRGARGGLAEAAELNARALAAARSVYGEEHANTLTLLGNQASRLEDIGRVDEAEALWQDGIDRMRRMLGENDKMTLINRGNLAELWFDSGRPAEAEAALRDIVPRFQEHYGPGSIGSLHFSHLLGTVLSARGAHQEAADWLAPSLAQARESAGMQNPQAQDLLAALTSAQEALGWRAEARAGWRELYALRLAAFGEGHEQTRTAAAAVARLAEPGS